MEEPTEECNINSMIYNKFKDEDNDSCCKINTVIPSRTFLEKIFLLAEDFQKQKPRSLRMTRHLYDLERLMDTQFALNALSDTNLYYSIVQHRRTYFALKYVDYNLLLPDKINFIIPDNTLEEWKNDYLDMKRYFIYGQSLDFEDLMTRLHELQKRVRNIEK